MTATPVSGTAIDLALYLVCKHKEAWQLTPAASGLVKKTIGEAMRKGALNALDKLEQDLVKAYKQIEEQRNKDAAA